MSHLLQGRFSHHWVSLQQDHIDHDEEYSSLLTGERWLKKVLHHLWSHLHLAWKLRHTDFHGIDKADQEAKHKAKLRSAIVALYAAADKLDYLDKRLFEITLLTCLGKSADAQAAWINVVTPTVRIATADAADKLITTQRDICSFFTKRCGPAEQGDARG
jgi:hypothetical protein